MTSNGTTTAKKTYCVWADYVRRVYQHVEAASPQEAYEMARHTAAWDPCDSHDNNGYRLSNEVQDLDTEEFIPIHGCQHCQTCGSEIVETINDSSFREGECDRCEHQRYHTQPELLQAVERMKAAIDDMLADDSLEFSSDCTDLLVQIAQMGSAGLNKAYGHAA